MLPIFISHQAYQALLVSNVLDEYPNPYSLPKSTWTLMNQFYHLDLSDTYGIIIKQYSAQGPLARNPISLFRSYLLMIKTGETSITHWIDTLKLNPLYAFISGFEKEDLPGVGTFYDFFSRCWLSESNNFHAHERVPPRKRVPKGAHPGDKTPINKNSVSEKLFAFFEKHHIKAVSPFGLIFELYHQQFLKRSHDEGLIDLEHLSIAGDGTPIVTSVRQRKRSLCHCYSNGKNRCNCKRYFSQPDANIGWDSYRQQYFNGYHLYMFVASDSANDLPIFPMLHPASRHDLPSFIQSFYSLKAWLPEVSIHRILLDSAHDAMSVYKHCSKHKIVPFIDLNNRRYNPLKYKDSYTINNLGVPICKAGLPMVKDGTDRIKRRLKYRCPQYSKTRGCFCKNPCTNALYGRRVHLPTKDNPRLFCIPSRDSKKWRNIYKERTSVERSNKREKIDYKIEAGKHRSSKMWYCRLYAIMMLQHLDAWTTTEIDVFQKK